MKKSKKREEKLHLHCSLHGSKSQYKSKSHYKNACKAPGLLLKQLPQQTPNRPANKHSSQDNQPTAFIRSPSHPNPKPDSQQNPLLSSYENSLNLRISHLRNKWEEIQVLQKNIYMLNDQQRTYALIKTQNQFYVAKITQLQNQLKRKQNQIIILKNKQKQNNQLQKYLQNNRLKQQNLLLQRQNVVLKKKLKQIGFF